MTLSGYEGDVFKAFGAMSRSDVSSTECLSTEIPAQEVGLATRAAVTTLTQNVLGSGVLALPYAMCSAGILGGTSSKVSLAGRLERTGAVDLRLSPLSLYYVHPGESQQHLGYF